ncbi:hypothetical protein HYX07_04365 [Candidatus Woesearchaeota archaeon]|nr:hypothetical protein [Candidatus Woesearchaeota archaeon]
MELAYGNYVFKCVLVPTDIEGKEFIDRLPQDIKLKVVFEVKAKNIEFRGTAKFSNFNGSGKRPMFFLNSTNGNFLLIFDISSTKGFRKSMLDITRLQNERFELAFEKPWF